MSLADNLEPANSETMPPQPSSRPTSSSGGRPAWLLPVIIGLVLCCLLACVAVAFTVGPMLGQATTLATMCVTANPEATQADCQAWVTDILQNHPDAYATCQESSDGDINAMYQCLLDEGVSAP